MPTNIGDYVCNIFLNKNAKYVFSIKRDNLLDHLSSPLIFSAETHMKDDVLTTNMLVWVYVEGL